MNPFRNIHGFLNKNATSVISLLVSAALIWAVVSRTKLKKEVRTKNDTINELLHEQLHTLSDYQVTTNEMAKFMNHFAPEMRQKLDSHGIAIRNIRQVVVQETKYIDTTGRKTDLTPILNTIQQSIASEMFTRSISVPVIDKSPCLLVRGNVTYNGQTLELDITERRFKSINEVVTHMTRNQWKLLGLIPTRLFGKKALTVTVLNSCGESKTTVLTKKKGKWLQKQMR